MRARWKFSPKFMPPLVVPMTMADIKQGSFVGIASLGTDADRTALEALPRGANLKERRGHRARRAHEIGDAGIEPHQRRLDRLRQGDRRRCRLRDGRLAAGGHR